MKKKVVLLLITILIFCSFAAPIKSDFNISTGDVYHFDVLAWNWKAVCGPNSSSAYGFGIDNHLFAEGEDLLVRVLDTPNNYSADWRIEKDGYSEEHLSSDFGVYLNMQLLVYSTSGWFLPQLPINETRIQKGKILGYFLFPFHGVDDVYWDYFRSRANSTFISSLMTTTIRNYTDIQVTFDEKKNLFLYEQYMNYDYAASYGNDSIDFTAESYFLLSVDKTTGVLQGFKAECKEFGIFNGADYELQSENHIEIKDYNLPKFNLGEYAGFSGFSFIIIPCSIITLAIIRTVFKIKRRRSYSTKKLKILD